MTSTSSTGRQSFAATGTSTGEHMFSLNEFEKFGPKELEETYQQLMMDGLPIETQQPNDEVHVLRNVIDELIKENQRLSQKIDNMETTQGKMLIILLDLKNNHLNGQANIQVAVEPLRKKNSIPVIHAPDVQTMTNEGKSNAGVTKKIHGLKGISPVIICNDEGEAAQKDAFGSSVSQGKGKSVAIEHQNRDDSRAPMNVPVVDSTNVFKKLSFTPSPSTSKRRNPPTPLNKRTEPPFRIPGSSSKNFNPIVFKVEDYCWGLRADFQCMIPEGYIITIMANTVTWNQRNTLNKEVWCLPPLFATQIDMKTSEDVLEKMFGNQFMPPFQHLKFIYVPIEDHELFHWYLMVINIPLRKIYHLDTNMTESIIKKKHEKIRAVMDESIMRVRMVMALLLGAHNECRELILEAANALWLDLHVKRDLALNLKRQRRSPQVRDEMH
ncbi:hypothetical protein TSUD_400320 [Trifolium subterraneum]|uniref:Ubiquitin-like protease family profile domain-containing protein n=1 Tax=Trifolium subterraneum TaxID=3900 RepID=A0A2Z6NRQ4_TRISU|nr:hypothetical protein TSUD_400320 [Trifolium subterraneum]